MGNPVQAGGQNARYRRYRTNMAKRFVAREQGSRFVPPGYILTDDATRGPDVYHPDIIGCYVYFKTKKDGWHLAEVAGLQGNPEQLPLPHTLRMLDLGKRYSVHLRRENLKVSRGNPGDWCFHYHNSKKTTKHFAHDI